MVLKTLFRSPLKAMLTFLLIAAASFALFSRVTDYAVTMREIARAESFCKGVAALDNTASYVILQGAGSGQVSDYTAYEVGARPWPSNGQIAEFSSLPGVTLADTRYMTAGLVGGYKRLVGDPYDIGEFRQAAEPLAAEIGIPMRFSDGGWLGMKDSFEAGRWAASLTAMLSIAGAALALFLAVYLYLGRNRKVYAIMRTLGVPGKKARDSLVLPFFLLSVWGIPAGGMAGLAYTSWTAGEALAGMAANAPYGYVADTALPPGTVLLCLLLELAFIFSLTLVFLWKIKKIPPLELLQDGAVHQGRGKRAGLEPARDEDGASGADIAKIPEAGGIQASSHRKYPASCQVAAFIWRHMRRSIGKAAIPLGLAAALMGGVGMFVLARIAYQDAAKEIDVKGRALMFSSSSVGNLSSSGLVEDFYSREQ